jgi:hypothetical protein
MKTLVAMLVVLVAFATTLSAGEIDFSKMTMIDLPTMANKALANCIARDPVKTNIFWAGGRTWDVNLGGTIASYGQGQVAFDRKHNVWGALGTRGLMRLDTVAGTEAVYGVSDGLPSTQVSSVVYDSAFNRLIVGTLAGVSIVQLDANENPTTFANALSLSVHWVGVSGKDIYLVNSSHAMHFDGSAWTIYDSTNSPLLENCFAGTMDKDGNFYVATSGSGTTEVIKAVIAKFNHSTQTWDSIDVSAIDSGMTSADQICIDQTDQLWIVFPEDISGPYYGGYLVQMDLATRTVVGKSPINGTSQYSFLDERGCGGEPALGLYNGNILIGANGKIVVGNSANAVIYRLAPKVERGSSFEFIGCFNSRGQLVSKIPTFSNNKTLASGMNFMLYRTAEGKVVRAEEMPIVR